MKYIFLLILSSLFACGSGSNITSTSPKEDQNASKFDETKFGISSFN
tara:strand:+ start:331 stop:471 length:141 start_codon:yes stop_codon:yes gene_type:complete